jgi:class 3 adenylate cyclase
VGEERKVVSVLFVDLVGFTSRSDRADPEDVRATLRPYHERVKIDIERFGGTVEKFIGDAVMAVFGAPVSHEDDAERAVRAGLRILETIEELREEGLEIAVRADLTTGEGVVALGARPERGEGIVTGDVVNTAARLQSAAPVGAVIVVEATRRSTESVITFEPLEPVAAKGKAEPIPVWRATHARSRVGQPEAATHTPFAVAALGVVDGAAGDAYTPVSLHATTTGRAILAEARERTEEAAALYAEAAAGWDEWGSVPERAYALLGLGRGGDQDAAREAVAIFERLGARPVVAQAA